MTAGANYRVTEQLGRVSKEYQTMYFTKFNHAMLARRWLQELSRGKCLVHIELRNEREAHPDKRVSRWKEWITLARDTDLSPKYLALREDSMYGGDMVNQRELQEVAQNPEGYPQPDWDFPTAQEDELVEEAAVDKNPADTFFGSQELKVYKPTKPRAKKKKKKRKNIFATLPIRKSAEITHQEDSPSPEAQAHIESIKRMEEEKMRAKMAEPVDCNEIPLGGWQHSKLHIIRPSDEAIQAGEKLHEQIEKTKENLINQFILGGEADFAKEYLVEFQEDPQDELDDDEA